MAQVRESITHIFGLGRFQDVQVDALAAPGGVSLRYNLVPLHNVQRVDFRGQPSLALSRALVRELGHGPVRHLAAARARARRSRDSSSSCIAIMAFLGRRSRPLRLNGTIRIARCWSSR